MAMAHPELACFDQTYLIPLDGGATALVYQTYQVKPGWSERLVNFAWARTYVSALKMFRDKAPLWAGKTRSHSYTNVSHWKIFICK